MPPGEFEGVLRSRMDVVLTEVCRDLSPHGGDHETRKYIAEQLIDAASSGMTTLSDFTTLARRALQELSERRSA